jgi:acyl-CoA dehydrogenase
VDEAPLHCSVVDIVTRALRICGTAGYRNDSTFSLTRHLRDAHSAALIIGNDRMHLANSSLLLVYKDDFGQMGGLG